MNIKRNELRELIARIFSDHDSIRACEIICDDDALIANSYFDANECTNEFLLIDSIDALEIIIEIMSDDIAKQFAEIAELCITHHHDIEICHDDELNCI